MSFGGRVVLISCFFPRSVRFEGVGSLSWGLARYFSTHGWRVKLLLPAGDYPAVEGIELITYPCGFGGLKRYKKAIAHHSGGADAVLAVENNPNMGGIVNVSQCLGRTFVFFYSPLQSPRIVKEMGLARQTMVHAVFKNAFWSRLQNWAGRRCLVSSEYQAQQLRRLGPASVDVLPVCGYSRDEAVPTRQDARRQLGWDDTPVVGYLGHFSRAKGVDVLVEAFANYGGPGMLALAYSGKGKLRPANQALLEQLIARGRVRMLGKTDVKAFLAACDVVALPYVTSSIFHQPQVLLESFAVSTSVITTKLGGFPEAVEAGDAGLLVEPRDPGQLAEAIAHALENLDETHERGRRGRETFERSGCVDSFVDGFERLLEPVRA